jgi:hypothetical protein
MMLLEAGNLFKELRLKTILPLLAVPYSLRSLLAPLAWATPYMNGRLCDFSQNREEMVDDKRLWGGSTLARVLGLCGSLPTCITDFGVPEPVLGFLHTAEGAFSFVGDTCLSSGGTSTKSSAVHIASCAWPLRAKLAIVAPSSGTS